MRVILEAETITLGFVGAVFVFGLVLPVVLRFRGDRLPNGSVVKEREGTVIDLASPRWAKVGVVFAMSGSIVVGILYVTLVLLGFWSETAPYLAISLPTWLNWVGLVGIWAQMVWGISVMYYNVNYIPLSFPIPNRYVLATGGPYRIVRHPMYFAYIILNVSLFLATGFLLLGVVALGWLAVRRQIAAEEAAMLVIFGEVYEEYMSRTSQLFPLM